MPISRIACDLTHMVCDDLRTSSLSSNDLLKMHEVMTILTKMAPPPGSDPPPSPRKMGGTKNLNPKKIGVISSEMPFEIRLGSLQPII